MSDKAPTYEQEISFSSTGFNDKTISRRFGTHIFERDLKTKEDLEPVILASNLITTKKDIPGAPSHTPSLEITKRYDRTKYELRFAVSLIDRIGFNDLFPNKSERDGFNSEMYREVFGVASNKIKIEETKYLSKLSKEFKDSKDWDFFVDYYDGSMDGGMGDCAVRLVGKPAENGERNIVRLDFFGGSDLNIKVPMSGGLDKNLDIVQDAVNTLSRSLDLRYSPQLKYEFVYPEGAKIESFAQESVSYPEYFYKSLENWKSILQNYDDRLRAIIGVGKSGEAILILEDPTLESERRLSLENYMRSVSSATLNLISPKVFSHNDIYSSFFTSVRSRAVNPNLMNDFPVGGDFRDWLHMFVDVQGDKVMLVEDYDSNLHNDTTKNLIQRTLEEYGIENSGTIPRDVSEKIAKRPMLIPTINSQSAEIANKYGVNAAKKYRQSAINWLINGSLHSKEVYDTFQILLKANKTK